MKIHSIQFTLRVVLLTLLAALIAALATATSHADDPKPVLWLHPACKPMPTSHLGPFVRLKDGGILTVDKSEALVSRDEGQSWQAFPMFADPAAFQISDERAVLYSRQGTVVVAFQNLATRSKSYWDSKTKDFVSDIRLDVCIVRSLDGGRTWTDAQVIQTGYAGCVRGLVQAADGTLVVATQNIRRNPAHYATTVYYSTDEAQTWKASQYVDADGQSHNAMDIGGHGHHDGAIEPTVEVLADGRMWMLIRTGHDWFWQAFSNDNGRTWRNFDRSSIAASAAPGLLKRLHSGRLMLVWNQLYPEGRSEYRRNGPDWHEKPASYHREELSVAFSEDEGQTWTKALVIARQPDKWLSYPYVFERQPGELWISTMQGGLRLSMQENAIFREQTQAAIDFKVKLETVMKHDDGKFLWFHPRAAAIPARGAADPAIVMTIQKHLKVSDYYSGLHVMTREQTTSRWIGPVLPAELDWHKQPDGVTISVADVTPGWHAPTGKLLAIGCQVRYSPKGKQLDDIRRAHQTVYAVLDPLTGKWSPWQVLELPPDEEFNFVRNACSQWLVEDNGNLLVPLYIGKSAKDRYSTTVAECRFDGEKLTYLRNGNVLRLDVARGLYEPSLIHFAGRYFLTLRNDLRGYVSVSEDGSQFTEPKPWLFDDGGELGSYNTQQHWLAHSEGLFLIYTRRGANNDHIIRHRAPLFMSQVDPQTLRVLRSTEKIVVPERGAELGNFGAAAISESESWITVSEGMFMKDSRQRGAEGATFIARVIWSQPNKIVRR